MPRELHAVDGKSFAIQALADEAHLGRRAGQAVDQQHDIAAARHVEFDVLDHVLPRNPVLQLSDRSVYEYLKCRANRPGPRRTPPLRSPASGVFFFKQKTAYELDG